MVTLAFAVKSSWLVITDSAIISITRVASRATMVVFVTMVGKIVRGLILPTISQQACGMRIVGMLNVMTRT